MGAQARPLFEKVFYSVGHVLLPTASSPCRIYIYVTEILATAEAVSSPIVRAVIGFEIFSFRFLFPTICIMWFQKSV